jgi:hypothetical protein
VFKRVKKWITPKPKPKVEHKTIDSAEAHDKWVNADSPLGFTQWIKVNNYKIVEQKETEDMNKIRLGSRIDKTEIKYLEDKWLVADTPLSFVDWLYVYHNIFKYTPNRSVVDLITTYRGLTCSEPTYKNYVHFAEWCSKQEGEDFFDHTSGRTCKEICALWDSVHKREPRKEPSEKIVLKLYEHLSKDEVAQARADRTEDLEYKWLRYSDWLLIFRHIVHSGLALEKMIPEAYVKWYNNGTISNPESADFQTFYEYIMPLVQIHPDTVYLDKVTKLCREVWTQAPKKAVKKEKQAEEVMVCDVNPRYTFTRMSLEQLDSRIAQLKEEAKTAKSKPIEQRLHMAEKYRIRLVEEG